MLLLGSLIFVASNGIRTLMVAVVVATFAFLFGKMLKPANKGFQRNTIFVISLLAVTLPWLFIKLSAVNSNGNGAKTPLLIVGVSFYTLEMISYLSDIFKEKLSPEKNYLSFMTYALYFPKFVQGPISRYEELKAELFKEKRFDETEFTKGFVWVLFGFFLKLMIADKAALLINPVFESPWAYQGIYCVLAAVLYSIELYADFTGCVYICLGISRMFGVRLFVNFNRPYMATSFKDFWKRWHISLSKWLSDYVYIPLGGSRHGSVRRVINLFITFLVSAFWHGLGVTFFIWGMLHALYRVCEDKFIKGTGKHPVISRLSVFFFATVGWVFFRADTLTDALSIFKFSVTGMNRSMFDANLISNALGYKEAALLALSIVFVLVKEIINERDKSIMSVFLKMPFIVRLALYCVATVSIVVLGTYGFGFDASAFIYGGF